MPKSLTSKSSTDKKQLRDATLLMRYRTTEPNDDSRRYLSYKVIAKALSLSVYQV